MTMAKGAKAKLKRKVYEKKLRKLQVELWCLQEWVKATGERAIVVLDGRDAAGKGGLIKAIAARVSPRVFRIVALPAPSDREKAQMFMQRYIEHLLAGGDIVIFDRSCYNRAGVKHVMGFCTPKQHKRFLELCPVVEKLIVDGGTRLINIWLEVGQEEQKRRFMARIEDPVRQWKLNPMDLDSYAIAHILAHIPCKRIERAKAKLPKRSEKRRYDDQSSLEGRRFVAKEY
jgi:polyphosphate kinase